MPHRILVVDESQEEREALERYLRKDLGYDVTAAASALEAFEATLVNPYDLAIISTQLEEVSGIEAYMRLRAIQSSLQAVFFTGEEALTETDQDFLRFSVPEERVLTRTRCNYGQLTRLIISILGPPVG